jgi:SAM-dependent methyltransferase
MRGVEFLDDPNVPADVRARSMQDVARSNALFGGTRSAMRALRELFPRLPRNASLLDVGTGTGDIPERARRDAAAASIDLTTVGFDVSEAILRCARARVSGAVAGDARRLPFADAAFDVVICSQVLHHFFDADTRALVNELHRVSRAWIVVSDLRRSWLAAAGFWMASVALRFHPVTRHDGVVSVLRGFTRTDLSALIESSTGRRPVMRDGVLWRVSATWRK